MVRKYVLERSEFMNRGEKKRKINSFSLLQKRIPFSVYGKFLIKKNQFFFVKVI